MRSFKLRLICLMFGFVLGCAAQREKSMFPNQHPASSNTQVVADRVAQAHIPVWIWGSVEDKGDINLPFCITSDGIHIHARFDEVLDLAHEHDLLALFIGHELRHAAFKRSADPVRDELEADALGVVLTHRAGYDAHRAALLACSFFLANGIDDSEHPPARKRCEIMGLALRYLEAQDPE